MKDWPRIAYVLKTKTKKEQKGSIFLWGSEGNSYMFNMKTKHDCIERIHLACFTCLCYLPGLGRHLNLLPLTWATCCYQYVLMENINSSL